MKCTSRVPRHLFAILMVGASSVALAGCGSSQMSPLHPPAVRARPAPAQHKLASRQYTISLTRSRDTQGAGFRPRGSASITLVPAGDQVCWKIARLEGVPDALHISVNRGVGGSTGPVLVTLGSSYRLTGCQRHLAPELVWQIESHPARYYLTIANAKYPAGAVRGQF